MFKNVEDLKEFISWAKSEKIQHLKVGEVEVLFSNLALMPEMSIASEFDEPVKEMNLDSSKLLFDDVDPDEDEDLFYSAGPQRN